MEKNAVNRKSGQARLQRLWRPPAALRAATRLQRLERSDCGQVWAGSHCGQATIEYAIVAGVLVAVVAIMYLLRTTFVNYGERLLAIIVSDYP